MRRETSFSGKIKNELSRQYDEARHCRVAETAAIISMAGRIGKDSLGHLNITVRSENIYVVRKCFTLVSKTFNINSHVETCVSRVRGGGASYAAVVKDHGDTVDILRETGLTDPGGRLPSDTFGIGDGSEIRGCCKRAFLRGAFLAAGSVSDPQKSYHIEIVCMTGEQAERIKALMASFELDAKITVRKNSHVVYLKEGSQIVDLLNVMGAPVGLMEMENVRIMKEVRNGVNRKVNCEAANIGKTVSAAMRQIEDIQLIRDTVGLDCLPDDLRRIALLRVKRSDASLKELGELLPEPIGKSGVNHRLRRIGQIARDIRRDAGVDLRRDKEHDKKDSTR